ncbi:MAG: AAA family ATPase [Phycisphaerales bacterium JB043]
MTSTPDVVSHQIEQHAATIRSLLDEVERVVVGQEHMVEGLLVGMLTGGHVLLEGVPGLAKTLTVTALAGTLHATFSRIQFTPDLLPADLIGTLIYNPREGTFTPRKGPIFANIVLADEINRAPAKVQSALLEAMQEQQVTIGDTTYPLEQPFLVLATQNPIEQEGTYPLPEAQVDRFLLKLTVSYPSRDDERTILDRMGSTTETPTVTPIIEVEKILELRALVDSIHVDDAIKDYIVDLVHATREPRQRIGGKLGEQLATLIEFGASPRASLALLRASKARAFLEGRAHVIPSDIKHVAHDVLRHRVLASYEAQAEGLDSEHIIEQVLGHIPVP